MPAAETRGQKTLNQFPEDLLRVADELGCIGKMAVEIRSTLVGPVPEVSKEVPSGSGAGICGEYERNLERVFEAMSSLRHRLNEIKDIMGITEKE